MANALYIGNVYSQFITNDNGLKDRLYQIFRCREEGYFFNPLYKQRKWDGYTNYFSKKGQILTGLLPELKYALQKFTVEYQVVDERKIPTPEHLGIDADFLKQWGADFSLYDYQVDLINAAAKHKRGIIKSPTGSGKSNVMVGILRALGEMPSVILTDTKDLVEQNYENLLKSGFKKVGRVYDKYNEPNIITCSTTQSSHKLEKLIPHIRCLMVDEVHACISAVPIKFYKKLENAPYRFGISATPFKNGGKEKSNKFKTKGYFGPVFLTRATESGQFGEITTKELQKRKILSSSHCTFFEINKPQLPYAIYQDAVKYGISENPELHKAVRKIVQTRCEGRTLILVERLDQGDILEKIIPGAFWIKGEDEINVRKSVIEKLKSSPTVVAIVSQKLISKGLDVKIHNLINAAGGKAIHSIIQRMGRGLRTAEDKDMLNYFDFLFNINEYLRDHSEERINTLKQEGHTVEIKELE